MDSYHCLYLTKSYGVYNIDEHTRYFCSDGNMSNRIITVKYANNIIKIEITDKTEKVYDFDLNKSSPYLLDYSTSFDSVNVSIFFKDIKSTIIKILDSHDAIVGCIAWLTDFDILDHMSKKSLGIVVQKERYIRYEYNISEWRLHLRHKYDATPKILYDVASAKLLHPDTIFGISPRESILGRVRCFGLYSYTKMIPLMHHKFLVCGTIIDDRFTPTSVITGSFNFSYNASKSLENILYIRDESVAKIYHREWASVYAVSENIDWESSMCRPMI
jgi:hypothetical protein